MKPTPGSQLALFVNYSYHGCITDRDGDTLALEADHRRHAEIENAIRDLKYGVGLNHLPSGRFPANPEPAEGGLAGRPGDGPQPGTLDGAHRSGRAGSDHQDPPAALLLSRRTAHPFGAPPHFASAKALALEKPVQSRPAISGLTAPLATDPPASQLNVSANSRQLGSRGALPAYRLSNSAISLTTATVGSHRRPQIRLQTAANLPSTRIRAQIIAPVTPSTPFHCPHAVHTRPSVDSG